jgi:hypothetical protein
MTQTRHLAMGRFDMNRLQLSDGRLSETIEYLQCLRCFRTAACFRATAVLLADGSVIGRTSRI